ncbi:phosphoribosylformimino-5-aminoimidazole carboxamide ribotide isomerase [Methanocella sp. CWC-04]|uniref:Phosphoribosylformimino-5-aminoimidazole carboxamide ribotide isomerase n=2 Tax=Methanooceanicella nereidis TaxID=2052831 RepID=A0AAP2RE62_9EURY|nr:phosphoribosylformimino-5-aminoimidazole carboxamide ribotide isomerase [Methanocella sp. CWC-04]
MRCILACDLKGGIVVRGVKGERDRYRPISESSTIVGTSIPEEVIKAIRPKETYIADLDRITGAGGNLGTIASLSRFTRTMSDTGASTLHDVEETRKVSDAVILGTETASMELIRECQGKGVYVSLDMKHGKMMSRDPVFNAGPIGSLKMLNEVDLAGIILLDVGRVGSGEGIDLEMMKNAVSMSKHKVIAGGGVRDVDDLLSLEKCGADGAIIASAVHFGKVPLEMLRG